MITDHHFSMIIKIGKFDSLVGLDFEGKLYLICLQPHEGTYTVTLLEEKS